ncbi:MAG: hypothetical protein IJ489_10190 [Clostridia bacterium]|nr:hypothetical protein [Clostridia bacterium]
MDQQDTPLSELQWKFLRFLYERKTPIKDSELKSTEFGYNIKLLGSLNGQGLIKWRGMEEFPIELTLNGEAKYEQHLKDIEDEAYLKKYNEAILQEAIIANKKARNANIIAIIAGALAFLSLVFDLIQFLFS